MTRSSAAGLKPGASAADHAGHDAGAESHEALPLRPIMQQLAADLAGFSYALWLEDYATMSQRSAAMADHTHISPEEIQRIESILGAEMAAFEEADEAVHESSTQLHEAAEARDLEGVLGRLHEVQTGCITCHTQFRERLRTDNAGGAM